MYLADGWKDYTLLDAGNGDKLERWGDVTLLRPDPQAVWPMAAHTADAVYHQPEARARIDKSYKELWQE